MSLELRRADELARRGRARAAEARRLSLRLDRRALLRRAWVLARQGAARSSGRARVHLAEALRLAWHERRQRLEVAAGMAEERLALDGRDRFALTVTGLLALREAEAARATIWPDESGPAGRRREARPARPLGRFRQRRS